MKSIVVTFSIIILLLSCNSKDKNITQTEVIEISKDTIETAEKPDLNITKDFVLGKFDYKRDSTFIKIDTQHASKDIYLKKEAYKAFLQMVDAANRDDVDLKIVSGTRNFEEQKLIWERKWRKYKQLEPKKRALKILEYSSMPSSSRHHWGTDIDLNSLNNSYFNSGKGLKVYEWLIANANSFGFYQVYTDKSNGRTGYNLEKWHWSYLPLASKYLEFYNANINTEDISRFEGAELAEVLLIIEEYVNGISEKAKQYK
ncbi:M15 family metallopeptidase [Winogradskyella ouciana]|uniref:D-alanyl-D-alanine carboxypeptidase family protein n=1 Tax=Winogradskyella ouciana TaxID=2608631 RepID=A0A7K1G9S8_9FLAO|nr:M15 family metallopeptidase [Winogradskyella ouciana]MTE26056.1 D-alanyl-D-alanine carboxypeptidase family protein [Winogradskyella ouciana]